MKSIKVSELKANLSRYLRLAARGNRIVVTDRDDPIAQLGPPESEASNWRQRLADEGRLRLGTQDWARLHIAQPKHRVNIQAGLDATREEPDEIRRR